MEENKLTLQEAHRTFAISFNGEVWDLLDRKERNPEDNARMLHLAHASCAHWKVAGNEVNQQRGEWMISRVNAVLGYPEAALRHAEKCLQLTREFPEKMEDFDVAFALEAMGRACAVGGDRENALRFIEEAQAAEELIKGDEDKKIFHEDFNGGDWNGMK